MKRVVLILFATLLGAAAAIPDQGCDLSAYKAQDGLKAQMRSGALEFSWQGERREQLRATLTILGQPVLLWSAKTTSDIVSPCSRTVRERFRMFGIPNGPNICGTHL